MHIFSAILLLLLALHCSNVYAIHMDIEASSLRGYIKGERGVFLLDNNIDNFEQTTRETRSLRGENDRSIMDISLEVENRTMKNTTVQLPDQLDNKDIVVDISKESTDEDSSSVIILTKSQAFQITISILLGILIIIQLILLATYIHQRTKRVLEFAQPIVICIFITASIIISSTCYLYLYTSNIGCLVREPIIFIAMSLMGSTIAGRAWRISTLMNNPLITRRGSSMADKDIPYIERLRQVVLEKLTLVSGGVCCKNIQNRRGGGSQRTFRVTITFGQMIRTILLLIIPQMLLQIVIIAVPALRYTKQISYYEYYGITFAQEVCQSSSSAIGSSWQLYVSILFALLPYACAYLLNIRTKAELDQLPDIIDERDSLKVSFQIFIRILIVAAPIIGLTLYAPSARAYATICSVLGLPLALCYHIAYVKLATTNSSNISQQRRTSKAASIISTSGDSNEGGGASRSSAAFAVKMAEMYSKIGRTEETVQLVEETLSVWKGSRSTGVTGISNSDGKEEVGSGFTKKDLKALEPEELQLIIQLLRIKGNSLIKLHGGPGFAMSAKINIDALKIFENCPAAAKMKDISIIFPIYNLVGIQMKGGVIDQDDMCSLENDLAEKYVHEAQVQVFHYARALANLAEWYGRIGQTDQAFQYFDIMKAIYMSEFHPKLLYDTYSVDRCAVSFATASLWHLQRGDIDKAIDQCDYVIKDILPVYNKKDDMIGLYHILVALIRVLKWNGEVDKAREVYIANTPEGIEKHFAMGHVHEPMLLLLRICDGSSEEYSTVESSDIELALEFTPSDMTDNNMTCDGWSIMSLSAEICLHLARRLPPGNAERERLVERGIHQSTIANKRVTASNGMIKHLLAYDAHKEIHKKLLILASEDVGITRTIIYDESSITKMTNGSISTCSGTKKSSLKSSVTGAVSLASRFVVKGDTSKGSNGSSSGAPSSKVFSAPSHVDTARKKVAFSHLSSFESHGSRHSENSQSSAHETTSMPPSQADDIAQPKQPFNRRSTLDN